MAFLHNMCFAAPPSDSALVTSFNGWAFKSRILNISDSCFSSGSCTCACKPNNIVKTQLQIKQRKHEACRIPKLGVNGSNNSGFSSLASGKVLRSFCYNSTDPLHSSLFLWEPYLLSSNMKNVVRAIDDIFKFHKAIQKDLEYLDVESTKLINCDEALLRQFSGRFHLLWGLYRAHGKAKDDKTKVFRDTSWKRKHNELVINLQGLCISIRVTLDHHICREELELGPLFDKHFSIEEQDMIVVRIIGTPGAEVLQSMLTGVISALTQERQNMMIYMWRQATRNTMFNEWPNEWWKGAPSCSRDDKLNGGFPEGGDYQENFDQNGIVLRSQQDFEVIQVENIVSTELGESTFPPKPGWRLKLL